MCLGLPHILFPFSLHLYLCTKLLSFNSQVIAGAHIPLPKSHSSWIFGMADHLKILLWVPLYISAFALCDSVHLLSSTCSYLTDGGWGNMEWLPWHQTVLPWQRHVASSLLYFPRAHCSGACAQICRSCTWCMALHGYICYLTMLTEADWSVNASRVYLQSQTKAFYFNTHIVEKHC